MHQNAYSKKVKTPNVAEKIFSVAILEVILVTLAAILDIFSNVHKCIHELVNVTNCFLDPTNLVIDTKMVVLRKVKLAMLQYIVV
jgi:hypothetical protein